MICLLVITDGRRGCIAETVPSARERLDGPITRWFIYDDSGDDENRRWLQAEFPDFEVHQHPIGRQGYGGAIRAAWSMLADTDEPFIFHLEDDFTFNRHVDLTAMAQLLDQEPHLAQVALRRQPWNRKEQAAGGVVEQHPDGYDDHHDGSLAWLEHGRFFTTNPCLYRRELMLEGWPHGEQSEGRFGIGLREKGYRFAFWGSRDSGEWVRHIGRERAGTGY